MSTPRKRERLRCWSQPTSDGTIRINTAPSNLQQETNKNLAYIARYKFKLDLWLLSLPHQQPRTNCPLWGKAFPMKLRTLANTSSPSLSSFSIYLLMPKFSTIRSRFWWINSVRLTGGWRTLRICSAVLACDRNANSSTLLLISCGWLWANLGWTCTVSWWCWSIWLDWGAWLTGKSKAG